MHNFLDGGRGGLYTNSTNMQNVYITKVIKTGNSLSVVIPKPFLKAYNLERGDQIVFGQLDENYIALHKLTARDLQIINLEKK